MNKQERIEVAKKAIECMDLTSLGEHETLESILSLVTLYHEAKAMGSEVAAVCVWPEWIEVIKEHLPKVKVAAVGNFPNGNHEKHDNIETLRIIREAHGDEVDWVFPYQEWIGGEKTYEEILGELTMYRKLCEGKTLKVILESGAFESMDLLKQACEIAAKSGANFLKTSTGKSPKGASLQAAEVLLGVCKKYKIGFKVSGGVKTLEDAHAYMEKTKEYLGSEALNVKQFRIGASGLLKVLVDELKGKKSNCEMKSGY